MPSPFPHLPPDRRGAVHRLAHRSGVLTDNPWQDPVERDVHVVLPPAYDPDRPLPAVLVLPGFTGTGEGLLARGLTEIPLSTRVDRLVAEGTPPFLAVLPDCMTTLVGSQYVDSPAIGAYASYLVDEILPFVASRYPVSGWAVVGKSSGGFGALHLAMTRPGVFRAVASHAGDLGFDLCTLHDLGALPRAAQAAGGIGAFVDAFWATERPSGTEVSAMYLLCCAAAFSPDLEARPIPARLPIDPETGRVDFDVLATWRTFDPLVRLDDPASREALRRLDLLFLDAGRQDEHNLHLGARRFARRLSDLDIAHHHEEFPGGHRGTAWRYATSLDRVARALTASGRAAPRG